MKLLKTSSILLLMIISTASVFGQMANVDGLGGNVLRESNYQKIDGSPYLFDKYKKAYAYNTNGDKFDVFARYDSYKEEIEVHNGGNPIILDSKEYRRIEFNFYDENTNQTVVMMFQNGFEIEGYDKKDYFHVLRDGDTRLLKKITTSKIDENEASYGGVNNVSSRFVMKERYVLLKKGQEPIVFKKISKGAVLKAFGDKRLASYIKQQGLKVKTVADVEQITEYYEGLN